MNSSYPGPMAIQISGPPQPLAQNREDITFQYLLATAHQFSGVSRSGRVLQNASDCEACKLLFAFFLCSSRPLNGIDNDAGYTLKGWPEGYMLFSHHKGDRWDKYLYGECDTSVSWWNLKILFPRPKKCSISFSSRVHPTRFLALGEEQYDGSPSSLSVLLLFAG